MGKIVKKFNQYVREDLAAQSLAQKNGKEYLEDDEEYGDFDDDGSDDAYDYDYDDDFETDREDREADLDDFDADREDREADLDDFDADREDDFEDTSKEDFSEDQEEEEPGYEGGRMLLDLAKKLGSEVKNNEIDYNGSKITCYSEDNKFRVNDQIIGNNVEEAFKNLKSGSPSTQSPEPKGRSLDVDSYEDELPLGESKTSKVKCNCCDKCNDGKCNCKSCKCKKSSRRR